MQTNGAAFRGLADALAAKVFKEICSKKLTSAGMLPCTTLAFLFSCTHGCIQTWSTLAVWP